MQHGRKDTSTVVAGAKLTRNIATASLVPATKSRRRGRRGRGGGDLAQYSIKIHFGETSNRREMYQAEYGFSGIPKKQE